MKPFSRGLALRDCGYGRSSLRKSHRGNISYTNRPLFNPRKRLMPPEQLRGAEFGAVVRCDPLGREPNPDSSRFSPDRVDPALTLPYMTRSLRRPPGSQPIGSQCSKARESWIVIVHTGIISCELHHIGVSVNPHANA